MADIETVEAARKKVAAAYNSWLEPAFTTFLSELGSRKKRPDLGEIGEDGAWIRKLQSKPLGWILIFSVGADGAVNVALSPSNSPNRLAGSLNVAAAVQGLVIRIVPVYRWPDGRTQAHPNWEWALIFVFSASAISRDAGGTSGNSVDFNHETGVLRVTTRNGSVVEKYIQAGLFRLLSGDEIWDADIPITYAAASEALSRFINVAPEIPVVEVEETEEEDA